MKSIKMAGIYRLVAFLLIAVILVIAVEIAASGWQSPEPDMPDGGEDGGIADSSKPGDTPPDNSENPNEDSTDPPEEIILPKYYNYLTGEETVKEKSTIKPICFIMNSSSPLYSISSADMLIEIPVENGDTRLAVYTPCQDFIGKIGSLAASRPYITRATDFFGGVCVYYGTDAQKSDFFPSYKPLPDSLNLSELTGYSYTENTLYLYTNSELINAGVDGASIEMTASSLPMLPFDFTAPESEQIVGDKKATTAVLPYSAYNETELLYSEETGLYTFCKNGTPKKDLLNAKNAEFTNAFILFADSRISYTEAGEAFEMNTQGGGKGYYLSGGRYSQILWKTDESGSLVFTDTEGNRLNVNRGKSYIGYFISSLYSKISFV